MSNPSLEQVLFSRRATIAIGVFAAVTGLTFSIGHLLTHVALTNPSWTLRFLLNMDGEGNLATWVNSLLLLAASVCAFLIARLAPRTSYGNGTVKGERRGWLIIGLIFLYLATDDAAQIHDIFAGSLSAILGKYWGGGPSNLFWYAWIPVFFVAGLTAAIWMVRFLRENLFKHRVPLIFFFIGLFLFSMNPVIEILENMRVDLIPPDQRGKGVSVLQKVYPQAWTQLQIFIVIEELFEMWGATSFAMSFLTYGRQRLHALHCDLHPNQQPHKVSSQV